MFKSIACSILTVTFLLAPLQVFAQTDQVKVNDVIKTFLVDLNGDGDSESVQLQVCAVDDEGYTERLVVKSAGGKLLWQGPVLDIRKGYQDKQPMFGAWPFGVSEVSLVADLDEDGIVELLAPAPQSDVRPTVWRLFAWKGNRFVHIVSGYLSEETEGEFNWSQHPGKSWVSGIQIKNGQVIAEVTQDQKKDGMFAGEALMVVTDDGLSVRRWLTSLSPMDE